MDISQNQIDSDNLERSQTENPDDTIEHSSGLEGLFEFVPSVDWSKATDEEVAIACAEAREFLGF